MTWQTAGQSAHLEYRITAFSREYVNNPERVEQLHHVEMEVFLLLNQVVSVYVIDDGLHHFGKAGREMGEQELNIPCHIMIAISGIKKAEQSKHLLKNKKKDTHNSKLIYFKGTNLNANA